MKSFFEKLDRMFTAIAYAEAGDLDATKEILDGNDVKKAPRNPPPPLSNPTNQSMETARIIEFKRAAR